MSEGTVPALYNKARLVLIPKKGREERNPKGYRPVCLIDGEAKVLERLTADRIREAIEVDGDLSNRQYGFRRRKSTMDALRAVKRLADEANSGPTRGGGTVWPSRWT